MQPAKNSPTVITIVKQPNFVPVTLSQPIYAATQAPSQSSGNVAEVEILDDHVDFVEKDSGLGNSLSSSACGEMSPSSFLNSFYTIGAAANDCETESLTTCLQLKKTAQRSDRPGNISKLCHFLAIYAVICKC
jgi:hypothetical protein